MKLRDYQEKAVEGTFSAWKEARSALVVLPTGCGKTVVFAEVIRRIIGERRVMVIAHREELVNQARDKIAAIADCDVGVEMAARSAIPFLGVAPPVVVATVQTLNSGKRMEAFDPREFAAVIIDEAHHATSKSYRRIIDRFLGDNPDCRLLGVTATPDRKDKAALGAVFEKVGCEYGVMEAIEDGWLVPVRQQLVSVESLDFTGIRTTDGDLNQKELAEVMEQEEILQRIAVPTIEICRGKRAIVFAASVKQAERLAEIFNRYGAQAAWICGMTEKNERRCILDDFRRGRIQFVVNVGVLTEGFDDAGVEAVVMARPTKSRALYAQMAGRATRPSAAIAARLGEVEVGSPSRTDDDQHPCSTSTQNFDSSAELRRKLIAGSEKPSCLILDFVGNSGRHKLITAADILGGRYDDEVIARAKKNMAANNPAENPDGEDVSDALEAAKLELETEKREIEAKRKSVTAVAKYVTRNIDPFNSYDLFEAAVPDPTIIISAVEDARLRKLLKKEYENCSLTRKQAYVTEMRRRYRARVATLGQAKFLARHGLIAPMRVDEASRAINRIVARGRWGK